MLSLKSISITAQYLYLSYNNGFWPLLMIVRIFNENVYMATNNQTRFEYLAKTKQL